MQNNKILIICYSFPPHPGIGGRRWAKFTKVLTSEGYKVVVVNANNIYQNTSFWNKDVDQNKIKIVSFKFQFQKILKNPESIINKIRRKIVLFAINKTKYNPHIITSLPNKHVWSGIKKLITEQEIKKVIVSGDPYLFYYACLLKKQLDFELILDYRDLWNDHTFYSTKIKLSGRQKKYFEYAENYAVNNCNKIIFVDEHLKDTVTKRIKTKGVSTFIIHNGFDKSDIMATKLTDKDPHKISFFFAGSIASDLNEQLFEFANALDQLSKVDLEIHNRFVIAISGEIDDTLVGKIQQLNLTNLTVKSELMEFEEYYTKLQKADIGVIILSDEYKNSFITKFTDYLLYDKFILTLGPKGDFVEYIENNHIGIGFDPRFPAIFFKKLIVRIGEYKNLNPGEKEKFDINFLARKLASEVIEN